MSAAALDTDARAFLDAQRRQGFGRYDRVGPRTARAISRRVTEWRAARAGGGEEMRTVLNRCVDGSFGRIPIRVYTPLTAPVANVMYLHGGGFVVGDLDTADAHCRAIAARAAVTVVSVDYALAPEHTRARALRDICDVLAWLSGSNALHAAGLPVGVAGDSAGGFLATWALRQLPQAQPVKCELLLYPMLDSMMSFPSARAHNAEDTLDRDTVRWFWSWLGAANSDVGGGCTLPRSTSAAQSTIVVTAGCDPLRDEATAYARSLTATGHPTTRLHYPTLGHGFFGWGAHVPAADRAIDEICGALRCALA